MIGPPRSNREPQRHGLQAARFIARQFQALHLRREIERVVADLAWLGLDWDEGPDIGGPHGPYFATREYVDMYRDVEVPAWPNYYWPARSIPGSHKLVATAAPHHGQAYGSLVLLDPQVPDDDGMGPVRRITPDVAFPESQGGVEAYGTPWPLSEHYYLCVYDDTINRGGRGDYGLYLVDAFGNRELIYRDPEIAVASPIPFVPRKSPPAPPCPPRRNPQPPRPSRTGPTAPR